MNIVRNENGTLIVPIAPERQHEPEEDDTSSPAETESEVAQATRVLHPGEGGYDEALTAWDHQQNPDRAAAVSTATGRQEAIAVVHAVAEDMDHRVAQALNELDDPEATGEALRYVLVGGVHSVEDFATEVANTEGGDTLPAHEATKIIGELLAELD